MYLIPQPRKWVQEDNGCYLLTYSSRITMEISCESKDREAAILLCEEIKHQTGLSLMIDKRMTGGHPGIFLAKEEELKNRLGAESYQIRIDENGVRIVGADSAGLLYGVQTMRQIIRQQGACLLFLTIEDYPGIKVRGLFHDITRGRVPTMDFLKKMADWCSFYKINQMHLYVEHTFLFDGFSEIWRDDTPLTAEDILEIDDYCAKRNIDLVPSIAVFGHMYKILRTKTYRHLSEIEEPEGTEFSFFDRMHHHTLNVTDEESFALVCRMIDQYVPLFRSKLFNINGDETFDLGKGRGKARADEVGTHEMYLEWINKVCTHVKELGKRPMFWGDIVAAHPETIKKLPKDIICMTWDYGLNPADDNVRKLWENGAVQYLCPGVQGWSQMINIFDVAYKNIKKMANFCYQFEIDGLLVTDWGDYGHIQYPEFVLPGIIDTAAMGWNPEFLPESELNEAISVLEYQDRSGKLLSIVSKLPAFTVMKWGELVEFAEEYRYTITGKGMKLFWEGYLPRIQDRLPEISACNQKIDECMESLYRQMMELDSQSRKRIVPFLIMADGEKLLNRTLAVLDKQWLSHTEVCRKETWELAADWENWYYEYKKLWRTVSQESELYRIGDLIFWVADYLRGDKK